MSYYRTCPYCGAHLDPNEICDCQKEDEDTYMSVSEVARRWGASTDLVYDLIKKGDLPTFKIAGKVYRISRRAVKAYELANTTSKPEPSTKRLIANPTPRKPVYRLA